MRLDPKLVVALNGKAWLLATCPDKRYRQGKTAQELATRACEQTNWKVGHYLDTLAAAHAESGNFDKAVELEEKALMDQTYEKNDGTGARERLKLYKDKKPFRRQ